MIRYLGIFFALHTFAIAAEILTFGVFIEQTESLTREKYQPLIDHLNHHLDGYRVQLSPLNRDEMERSLALNRLDILSTSPSHYEIIRNHNLLTRVIATTQQIEKGIKTEQLGGVIFTTPSRVSIDTLNDLKDKSIALMDRKSLGAYQAQAYECLQHGLDITRQSRLIFYTNQNAIVKGVLSGKADVGFVSTVNGGVKIGS